jgi:DNA-binding cell septation regulator SpoVG
MDIEVKEIRAVNNKGPLKAYVSVKVGDWTIHDWRIIKQDSQRCWISPPQTSWRDSQGQVHYKSLFSIPGELKQRIEVAILSAWEKEQKRNGSNSE